jgi:hypothetical protein
LACQRVKHGYYKLIQEQFTQQTALKIRNKDFVNKRPNTHSQEKTAATEAILFSSVQAAFSRSASLREYSFAPILRQFDA